jgi:hypothetical protein
MHNAGAEMGTESQDLVLMFQGIGYTPSTAVFITIDRRNKILETSDISGPHTKKKVTRSSSQGSIITQRMRL